MFKKTANSSQPQSLRMAVANVTDEYIQTKASTITGDDNIDVDSKTRTSLPQSVASIIKNEKIETLFNSHAGIKAKNIQIESDLKDKKLGTDWLLARMRAIDACGYEKDSGSIPPKGNNEDLHKANANADFFSEEELLKSALRNGKEVRAFETFVGCPFFTNHKNDDIEQARGKIINAFYDLEDHCVYTDVLIDAVAYPELARGIKEGIMTDCSMGCAVEYSLCSHCGNKASVPSEYCTHIANQKGRIVEGKKVYEINYGLKFIELSQVVDGACSNCKVINKCMDPEELLEKVADVSNEILKTSNKIKNSKSEDFKKEFFNSASNYVLASDKYLKHIAFKRSLGFKYASKQDLSNLYTTLQELKKVTVKLIDSEEVDFEFVEDLAEVLKKLQNIIVDLAEAGFGELPDGTGVNTGGGEGGMDTGMGEASPAPDTNPAPAAPEAPAAPAAAPQGLEFKSPINELQLASNKKNKLYIFATNIVNLSDRMEKHFENVREHVKKTAITNISRGISAKNKKESKVNLQSRISDNWHKLINKESGLMKSLIEVTEGKYTLRIANNTVTGIHDDEEFSAKLDELPSSIVEAYNENPHKAASMILASWKDGGIKTAYTKNAPPQEEVQEGQLENLDGNFKHVRSLHDEEYPITEGRLDEFPISSYTGNTEIKLDGKVVNTGEDRFTRKEMQDLPVQEGRLESYRANDMHMAEKPVQEGQLTSVTKSEFGRWTSDQRGNDVPTTEGQLQGQSPYQNAEKDRLGYAIDELPEGQLKAKRQGPDAYMSAKASVDALIKAAASAVIERGVTPSQVVNAFNEIAKYKKVMDGYIRELNSNNKTAKANIINRLNLRTSSKEISGMDVAAMVLDRIAATAFDDIETLKGYSNYLNKAASHLIENADITKTAIRKEVENEVARIKEASEDRGNVQIKEDVEKDAFKKALANYNSENHFIQFFSDELEDTDLEVLAADTLTDEGIVVTATNIKVEIVDHNEETNICTAKVSITSAPSDEESKLALAKSMLRQVVAQTPPVGTQFQDPTGGPQAGGEEAPAGGVGALTSPPPDFSPAEGGETSEFDAPEGEVDGEPQLPGDMCPVCGSLDIETLDDSYVCKNCDTEFTVKIDIEILNGAKALNNDGSAEEGIENEGEEMPEEAGMAPMSQPAAPAGPTPFPAQASMLIHPRLMIRTANYLGRLPVIHEAVALGQRCPNCASSKVNFEKDSGQCISCGVPYKVAVSGTENGQLKAEINWMATGPALAKNLEAEKENCSECKASVDKFIKKVASLSNNQQLLLKVSERLQKKASTDSSQAGMLLCQEDRTRDGFSKEASCEICETMKLSLELEENTKHAQFDDEEEADEVGSLDNPMDNFKDELTDDEDSVELDIEDSDDEFSDDMEDSDDEFEMSEEESSEEPAFLDNLPEEGVEENNISLDINVDTGNNEQSFEIEIDPETGEVTVVNETSEEEMSFDSDDEFIDIVDDESDDLISDDNPVDLDTEDTDDDVVDFDSDEKEETEFDNEFEDSEDSEDSENDDEIVQESNEEDENVNEADDDSSNIEDNMSATAMSSSKILPQGTFGGRNIDLSAVAKTLGLDTKAIKAAANQASKVHPLLRRAANVKIASGPNVLASVKMAQENKQTMPLDVEDDVDAGVPRDESVGVKQTNPKEVAEVFEKGYERGKNKNTTNVVPRDNSGDGVGGKKVTFEEEKVNKQTSGNPDDYVQTLVQQTKPTPAGNKDNKATASSLKEDIKKLVIAHNLNPDKIEVADAGSCYLVAHETRLFKFPKVNASSNNEEVVAKFNSITATVKADGQIVKSASTAEDAGNKIKPNPVDGKKNKGVTPKNKGVATASEDTVKPNPVDGKKNKAVTPKNKGYNTACSENAGNKIKPNPVDGKKNKGVTPSNKGVATASEDTIKPNKADGKKNKAVAPSKTTTAKVKAFVAKKIAANLEDLEVKEFDKSYVVANLSTGKIYNVKKN